MDAKVFRLPLAAAALLALAACASLGPTYTKDAAVPADLATVYVYRDATFIGGGVSFVVSANGVPLAALPAGGYFVVHVPPGEVELAARTEAKTSVTLDARAGTTYFVRGSVSVGVFVGHPHLVLVAADVGEREIADCKLVPDAPADLDAARSASARQKAEGPMGAVVVALAPAELAPAPEGAAWHVPVVDRRANSEMRRTSLGVKMGGVRVQPGELEIVERLVEGSESRVLGEPGDGAAYTCELTEFSLTTPSTLLYWDATAKLAWSIRVGERVRTIEATGTERTWVWPSAQVLHAALAKALGDARTRTDAAFRELHAAP
jgi:predicted small lipoprotein YifL